MSARARLWVRVIRRSWGDVTCAATGGCFRLAANSDGKLCRERDDMPKTLLCKLPDTAASVEAVRRTRVFVRMPSGEILPADLDLNWTIAQASDYIIAPRCGLFWFAQSGSQGFMYTVYKLILFGRRDRTPLSRDNLPSVPSAYLRGKHAVCKFSEV